MSLFTSRSQLVSREVVAADAGMQQTQFGRIHLTLACKAAAVEALHAAASSPFHCRRILKFNDLAQGFHDLVTGLKGHVGPQLTAGATVIRLCSVEFTLELQKAPTADAAQANIQVLLRSTSSLVVSLILKAIQVMHCSYCNLQWVHFHACACSGHVENMDTLGYCVSPQVCGSSSLTLIAHPVLPCGQCFTLVVPDSMTEVDFCLQVPLPWPLPVWLGLARALYRCCQLCEQSPSIAAEVCLQIGEKDLC